MSIPLDRLYHYLNDVCSDDILIYRWYPHGSKNLDDLLPLTEVNDEQEMTLPSIVAHDQEPLDYDYFESQKKIEPAPDWADDTEYYNFVSGMPALRYESNLWNVHDKLLLCHSEKNSNELKKFNDHFIGVYYWSHALIARDWFRYAKHDQSIVNDPTQYKYDFLIYNRAWTGTREYRLKFVNLLLEHHLEQCSLTSFSATDNNIHYSQHKFKNPTFELSHIDFEARLPKNIFVAAASADYVASDYNSAGIEIVLETLFDDNRIHLTEKILRPIACGKPFILASTPGALQYLKDYGFKTFGDIIDESYDTVDDPVYRLKCIVNEMSRIRALPTEDKTKLFQELNEIALYNRNLFFSDSWQQTITEEFVQNLNSALLELKNHKTGKIWDQVKNVVTNQNFLNKIYKRYHS